jgi:threonine dehydrogenase-like Zn-dependent dehydrogenase
MGLWFRRPKFPQSSPTSTPAGDLPPLLTHTFSLDEISEAYKLFGKRREGVIKVAIKP